VNETKTSLHGISPGGEKKARFNYVPIILLALLIYISFLLYQAVYFNYQTSKKMKSLRSDIVTLNDQRDKLEDLIAYYKTETFAELEARKKLGLKMPGEKVVRVDVVEQNQPVESAAKDLAKSPQIPNWQKWIDYLGGREI
jgi:cell division protein FtsB